MAVRMTDSFSDPASPVPVPPANARPFHSLLIVRLSAMGDIIHTLPAAAALREAFPDASIGWLVEERWTELLCTPRESRSGTRSLQRPLVDRVHTVNTAKWRRALFSFDTWQQIARDLREFRGVRYDAVIDFQGAIRSALLARWSGAPTVYGDRRPRESAASMFYTRRVPVTTNGTHVVQQAVELADAIVPEAVIPEAIIPPMMVRTSAAEPAQFPVDPDAENKITGLTAGMKDFVVLNPGAGWGAKRWPAERYGLVAKEIAKDGLRSLINYGPGEEDLAVSVEAASDGAAQIISCSISELISLTRRARLFIGGDTGPMHLAAALKIPVVAIFGPTNPVRNGPYATRSIVLRSTSSVTDHARHGEPEKGLLEITIGEVVAATRNLLLNQGPQPHIADTSSSTIK